MLDDAESSYRLSIYALSSSTSDVSSTYAKDTATKNNSAWGSDYRLAQFTTDGMGSTDYKTGYGYYYSWCAATANTSGSGGTCSQHTSGDALNSICPKGWHLPKGGKTVATMPNRNVADIATMTGNDFAYLQVQDAGSIVTGVGSWSDYTFVGNDGLESFALGGASWPMTGHINSVYGLFTAGSYGPYWSRTTDNASEAYISKYHGANHALFTQATDPRQNGIAIRCIAYAAS